MVNKGKQKAKSKKLTLKQKHQSMFLKTYLESLGNISEACKEIEINRATYYKWMREDEEFKQRFSDITDAFDDRIETTIRQMATSGDKDLLKFWASRKLKNRGFTEKTEVEHTGEVNNQITINIPKEVEELLK